MSNQFVRCSPRCESFKCGQRALIYQGRQVYCRWADDDCSGATCNYAICIRGRLLPNGGCGLTIKRKTNDEDLSPEIIGDEPELKLKGKILKRIKGEDIY